MDLLNDEGLLIDELGQDGPNELPCVVPEVGTLSLCEVPEHADGLDLYVDVAIAQQPTHHRTDIPGGSLGQLRAVRLSVQLLQRRLLLRPLLHLQYSVTPPLVELPEDIARVCEVERVKRWLRWTRTLAFAFFLPWSGGEVFLTFQSAEGSGVWFDVDEQLLQLVQLLLLEPLDLRAQGITHPAEYLHVELHHLPAHCRVARRR
jgi:hypothetical protein